MLKSICKWKGFRIQSWHIGSEHVHLYIYILPKFSVSYAVQILKGKTSSWIKKKTKKLPSGSLWNRGYYVSTIGMDKYMIQKYIESHGKGVKDLQFFLDLEKSK